jgi:hypothetical protein
VPADDTALIAKVRIEDKQISAHPSLNRPWVGQLKREGEAAVMAVTNPAPPYLDAAGQN